MNNLRKIILGVTAGIAALLLLLYISNIIIIGDKLGQISILLEILFLQSVSPDYLFAG